MADVLEGYVGVLCRKGKHSEPGAPPSTSTCPGRFATIVCVCPCHDG